MTDFSIDLDDLIQNNFISLRDQTSYDLQASLCSRRILAEDLRAMASSPNISNLTSLMLQSIDFDVEGITALGNSPHLQNLRTLEICLCNPDPAACTALGRSPLVSRLTALETSGWRIGAEGLAAFLAANNFDSLEVLSLNRAAMDDKAIELVVSAQLPALAKLDLRENLITAEGLAMLGRSEVARQLTHLQLNNVTIGKIGEAGLLAFAEAPNLRNLVSLSIGDHFMKITAETAEALAMSPNLGRLEHFELTGNHFFKGWAMPLSISPYLSADLREKFLWKLAMDDLKKAAKRLKLNGRSKLKRVELIAALRDFPLSPE